MPIKTLHLTYPFNEQSGGVATFYRALMHRAAESGREMVLVIPGDRDGVEQWSPTVRIYRVSAGRSIVGDRRYRVLLPHHFLLPGDTRFKKPLRDERPDVVEACVKYSLLYLLGFYRLGWIDGTQGPATVALTMERMDDNFGAYLSDAGMAMQFCQWYMGSMYFRLPEYHIAISRYVASELEASPWAAKLDKVRILPLGVDTSTFRPASDPEAAREVLHRELGIVAGRSERTRVLLYAGRLSVEKNLPLLLDTVRELLADRDTDYRLALIGNGMLRERLEGLARRELRGRLYLSPHVDSREKLAAMISGADLFLHPNPREPFGIGPLEAMSCGIPVVLPNEGGVLEYASAANSWVTPPNPGAFAAAIRQIEQEPGDGTLHIRQARATALAHTWTQVADRYFRQYEEFHREFSDADEPWRIPFRPFQVPRPWDLPAPPRNSRGEQTPH